VWPPPEMLADAFGPLEAAWPLYYESDRRTRFAYAIFALNKVLERVRAVLLCRGGDESQRAEVQCKCRHCRLQVYCEHCDVTERCAARAAGHRAAAARARHQLCGTPPGKADHIPRLELCCTLSMFSGRASTGFGANSAKY